MTKMLCNQELTIFCEQISMVIKAGISAYEGVCILEREATSARDQKILRGIMKSIEEGVSFPDALDNSNVFPKYMIDMLKIGELSGRTDIVLDEIGEYYRKEETLQESIRYAVRYPAIMTAMMGIVIGVLVIKVMPIFKSVFLDLGTQLSGFSEVVMNMGLAFSNSIGVILGILLIISIIIYLVLKLDSCKRFRKKFATHCIGIKTISNKIAVSRFAMGMSLTLASGLDIEDSLNMVSALVDHEIIEKKIASIQTSLSEGMNFSDAVCKEKLFKGTYNRMLGIGERTGAMDNVIKKISENYEKEIENDLAKIVSVIEPTLVAALSILVGAILLAVMLPLMGIMSAM